MKELIKKSIDNSIEVKGRIRETEIANIEKAALLIVKSLKSGGKLLVFGNGGSAADSQHIVAELVGRFKKERRALAAVALTTNSSVISAIANDYNFGATFSRQIEALGNKGDIALGISTSGNSLNVLEAMRKAKAVGMKTISMLGGGGGKLKGLSDISIVIDSGDTPRIQEAHIMIGHILCELIEEEFVR